jgi:hypothetical protein
MEMNRLKQQATIRNCIKNVRMIRGNRFSSRVVAPIFYAVGKKEIGENILGL